jgi:hypothetical protein
MLLYRAVYFLVIVRVIPVPMRPEMSSLKQNRTSYSSEALAVEEEPLAMQLDFPTRSEYCGDGSC